MGKGITSDSQKRGLFLHTASRYKIYIFLFFTLVSDAEDKDYAATLKALDDYFILNVNVPFERHLFRQISQSSEKTVDQFVCRLRQPLVTSGSGRMSTLKTN